MIPARKFKLPLCPQLNFCKKMMLISRNIAAFRVQNAFSGIATAFKGGSYNSNASYPAARKKKTYSHQKSKKGVVQDKLLHPLSTICITTFKPKALFSPSEAIKGFLHCFPCKNLVRCINTDTDSYLLKTSQLSVIVCTN